MQKTHLHHIYPSSPSDFSGIKRKWLLSCSQETEKVTICQQPLMRFILSVSSLEVVVKLWSPEVNQSPKQPLQTQLRPQAKSLPGLQAGPNHLTDCTDF